METVLHWLAGGSWLNLVFLVLAVLSIALSVYLYRNGKREKVPVYWPNSYPLVKQSASRLEGLEVLFQGRPIPTLIVTRVAFWNAGEETLRRADIAHGDPLRIQSSEPDAILSIKLAHESRPAIALAAKLQDGVVLIDFEFLDKNDGCIINVYHDREVTLELAGTLIGARPIYCAKPDHPPRLQTRVQKLRENLLLVLLIPLLPVLLLLDPRKRNAAMPSGFEGK